MTESPSSNQEKPDTKPREVRFVVRSAQEAVERVRESLGPDAKVISVRQVKGAGLQRFLAAPRLEIIARQQEKRIEPILPQAAPVSEEKGMDLQSSASLKPPAEESETDSEGPVAFLTCRKFLDKAGLPAELLARLEAEAEWRRIGQMNLQEGLPLAVRNLRAYLNRIVRPELPLRSAFLGGPGSGKTTALCKLLARDVFIGGRKPQVLRLEVDKPHLDDGLVMYCDVLGVPCSRSIADLDLSGGDPLYVDIPGYSLREKTEQHRILKTLDELKIDGRILVLNAAYDEAVLHRFAETGRQLGAQFQILTHLDELVGIGKLWQFLFDTERHLLFFSDGQNIAGDRVDEPFGYLLERTFPR